MTTQWVGNPQQNGVGRDGVIPPWHDANSESPGELRTNTPSFFGIPNPPSGQSRIIRARFSTGSGTPRARAIFRHANESAVPFWGTNSDIWYGCWMYLAPGFRNNLDSWVALHRWDAFVDGGNDLQGGLGIRHQTGRLDIMVNGNPHGSQTFETMFNDDGGSNRGFLPPEGQWFHVEVHQILNRNHGQALNELYINGNLVDSSTRRNYRDDTVPSNERTINRLRIGLFGSAQDGAITMYVSHQTIGTSQHGPDGGGGGPGTPAQVQNLRVDGSASHNEVPLAWDAVPEHGDLHDYQLQRRLQGQGEAAWTSIFFDQPPTTSFIDTGVSPSTSYEYRIRARLTTSNEGPWSSILQVSTPAEPPETPDQVENLRSTGQTETTIDLEWDPVPQHGDLWDYQLQRRLEGQGAGSWTSVFFDEAPTTTFTDTNLDPDTSYQYRVRARMSTSGPEGAWSDTLTISTEAEEPPPPPPPSDQHFYDFADEAVGVVPDGFTVRNGGVFSIQTASLSMNDRVLRLQAPTGELDRFISIDVADDHDDVEIVTRCWSSFMSDSATLQMYGRSDADPEVRGYLSNYDALNAELDLFRNPGLSPVALEPGPSNPGGNTPFFMRIRFNGDQVFLKVWTGGVGDEPAGWQLQYTDPDPHAQGFFGLGAFRANRRYEFDWVGVGLNGAPAPTSDGVTVQQHTVELQHQELDWTGLAPFEVGSHTVSVVHGQVGLSPAQPFGVTLDTHTIGITSFPLVFGAPSTPPPPGPGPSPPPAPEIPDRTYLWRGLELQHVDGDCGEPVRAPIYEVMEISGLRGTRNRVGDVEFPRSHGVIPGPHFAEPRTINMKLQVCDRDRVALDGKLAELQTAFQVRSDPADQSRFEWQPAGQTRRFVRARPTSYDEGVLAGRAGRYTAEPEIVLHCADPRIYSDEAKTVGAGIFDPGAARINYPIEEYPKDWPASGGTEVDARNNGNSDAAPLLRFFGPAGGVMSAVTISNVSTGVSLTVETDIVSGQILTVDMLAYVTASGGLIVAIDDSTRYGDWTQPRVPFLLRPGSNILRFSADGSTDGAQVLVRWRDTWL